MSYSLSYDGNVIDLGAGGAVIGRSASCKIMLDGDLVSRRHAILRVAGDRMSIEDLGSANGVTVNGELIRGEHALFDGDRIGIGPHELLVAFRAGGPSPEPTSLPAPLASLWDDDGEPFEDGEATMLLGGQILGPIDELLDAGKVAEADTLAQPRMSRVLGEASTGRLDAERCEGAARQALKLALATRRTEWLDFAFDVYLASGELLAPTLLDELAAALASLHTSRLPVYIAALRQRDDEPVAEQVLARLEAMARRIKSGARLEAENR